MSGICEREDELLDALGAGYVGAELESHVMSCASCSELRSVAGALLDDRAMAMMEAPVPSSGTMWWRMRLRQRQEAAATAQRTLIIGQAVTLAVAIALLVSFFGSEVAVGVREAVATIRVSTPILLAIATSLLAAPIAGWVAVRGK
ncbi:MAG TPA: hypothetical protein VEK79_10845 [Thermoanaerobaculia bacterium]|nr:hypothetical protein [Thermoanaerobaculia bacterium]